MKLAALQNNKAKLWVEGRKNTFPYLEESIKSEDKIIWIHSPSLGEFEQARPLIERIKSQKPQYRILISFFSPSGYEVRKNYPLADYCCYLPLDTKKNVQRFLDIVNPYYTFFIKYDFWANYLQELQNRKLKHYVVSAIFRDNQYFFKWHSKWMLKLLSGVDYYFVQNNKSQELLLAHGIEQASTVGDTRFDRVLDICSQRKNLELISTFKGNKPLFIAGSTWPVGEAMIIKFINHYKGQFKFIIASHEIHEKQLQEIESSCSINTIRYSQATTNNILESQVLIIDNIGLLSSLYAYADIAYIGGGFGAGIHNTLEAAVFGMPILMGPKNEKFQEAQDLKQLEVAKEIQSTQDMIEYCDKLLAEPSKWAEIKTKCANYVKHKAGASHQIIQTIFNLSE